MNKCISVPEYSTITYQVCPASEDEGYDEKQKCLKITNDTLQILEEQLLNTKFLEIYPDKIRTLNYAGVAKFGSLKIEILPKFFKSGNFEENKHIIMNNLLYMLNHSNLFNFKEVDSADLDVRNDFLEIIVLLFAKNLVNLLKCQQTRQYVKHDEELRFVKEKIITSQYMSNPGRLHIIPCSFHERSMNTLLNQTLKFTVFMLSKEVKHPETYRYLKEVISILDSVDLKQIHPSEIKKIPFNRLNEPFHQYIRFCEMFLRHLTTTLQASHVEFFSIMIPMEKLFEDFIATTLIQHPGILPLGYRKTIGIQKHIGYLAFENDHGFFEMRPDIVLHGAETIVIDTKYKILTADDNRNNISQTDLYQMYTYCRESGSHQAMLLYPEGINTQVPDRLFKLGTEQSISLHIKTISLEPDLSTETGLNAFIENLEKVFHFLYELHQISVMPSSVDEISA